MQLLNLAFPGETPPTTPEELHARLARAERELAETKRTLCELIAWTQQQGLASDELSAILNRYDGFLRSVAKAEATATDLVAQINALMTKGDDLAALRLYRQHTQAVWDRCHSTIGTWSQLSLTEKHRIVLRDIRQFRQGIAKP